MNGITIDRQGAFHNRSNGQYANKPGASSHTDLDWNSNQTQAWANATKSFAKTVNSKEAEEVFDKVRIVKGIGLAVVAAGLVSACGGATAEEPYSAPTPDDTYNQEADSDTSYDNDYDYQDYDYSYGEVNAEVGSVLSPADAESTREYLRGLDDEERVGRVVIERDGQFVVVNAGDLQPGDRLDTTMRGGINLDGNYIWRVTGQTNVWFSPDGSQVYVMDVNAPLTEEMRADIAWASSMASGSVVPQEIIDQQNLVGFSIYRHSGPNFMITQRPMDGQIIYEILWVGHHGLPGFDAAREQIRGRTATSEAEALRIFQPLFNAFPDSPIFGVDGRSIR